MCCLIFVQPYLEMLYSCSLFLRKHIYPYIELFFSSDLCHASWKHAELFLSPSLNYAPQNIKKYPSVWQIVRLCSSEGKFQAIIKTVLFVWGSASQLSLRGLLRAETSTAFCSWIKNTKTRSIFLWVVSGQSPRPTGDFPIHIFRSFLALVAVDTLTSKSCKTSLDKGILRLIPGRRKGILKLLFPAQAGLWGCFKARGFCRKHAISAK